MAKPSKKPIVIGVSGARGSFSEEEAEAYARRAGIKKYTVSHLITVENVLIALEKGEVDLPGSQV